VSRVAVSSLLAVERTSSLYFGSGRIEDKVFIAIVGGENVLSVDGVAVGDGIDPSQD